ncbi:MAG: non-canonical purine NTP pyrophosphatase, partial [Owenweeksia sp.]
MELIFATHNKHKAEELRKLIPEEYTLKSLDDLGIHEDIPETGTSLEENALIKARYLYERRKVACIADDTGLEVEALKGAPGVYSARYAGENASFDDNMEKLLDALGKELNR